MSRRVFIRLDDLSDGPLEVAILGSDGPTLMSGGVAALRSNDELIAFVPGTDVTHLQTEIPAKTDREARRAALFAVEDELAAPPDTLHVSVSAKSETGQRTLLVCDSGKLAEWIALLDGLDLAPIALVPEYCVLPDTDCAVDLGSRIASRIGGRSFCVDQDGSVELLPALLDGAGDDLEIHGAHLARQIGYTAAEDVEAHPLLTLARLHSLFGHGQDLRQGRFAAGQDLVWAQLRPWKRPAALCGAAMGCWLASIAVETALLNTASEALERRAQSAYTTAFGTAPVGGDPASSITARLASSRGGRLDFQEATAALYLVLQSAEGSTLRTLRFDEAANELRVSVDYTRYGDDLRIVEALTEAGLSADVGDTRASGALISGDLTVRIP